MHVPSVRARQAAVEGRQAVYLSALNELYGIQADLGRVPAAGHAGVISPDGLDDERCPVTGFDLTDLGDVRRREAM